MSSSALNKVRSSIDRISAKLQSKIELRDDASLKARKAIRLCGEAISLAHRERIEEAKVKLEEAKAIINELKQVLQGLTLDVFDVALQEYVEAESLVRIMEGKELPSIDEVQVTEETYALGLADLIGELRRRVLEEIRRGNRAKAEELYEIMKELYEALWPLEYPRSLVPGLRHKIDVMRRVIDETLHDLTLMGLMRASPHGS